MTRAFQLFSRGRAPVSRHPNPLAVYLFGIRLNRNDLFTVLRFRHLVHLLSRVRTACPYTRFTQEIGGVIVASLGIIFSYALFIHIIVNVWQKPISIFRSSALQGSVKPLPTRVRPHKKNHI